MSDRVVISAIYMSEVLLTQKFEYLLFRHSRADYPCESRERESIAVILMDSRFYLTRLLMK